MAVNLLDVIKGFIGKDVVSQIAGILGESTEKTQSAIGAAVPALMGAVLQQVSKPQGAQDLFGHLDQIDDSVLDSLDDALSGSKFQGLLDTGNKILSGLFGGNLSSLVDLMTKTTGLGGKSARSLLGLLAPIVMSVLGRQCQQEGLDAARLGEMLKGQKDFLSAVMPAGVGDLLGISGLSAAAGKVGDTVSAANRELGGMASAAAGAQQEADTGGSLVGKVLPVLALLALVFIAWKLFQPRPEVVPAADDDVEGIEIVLPEEEAEPRIKAVPQEQD